MNATTASSWPRASEDELIEALLAASRVLVAVATRSLAGVVEDVTLAQYRALVELAVRGPMRVADLAEVLEVERSTATRMCDRLVRKRLATRRRVTSDRRGVRVTLTSAGAELITQVSDRRRREIAQIVRRMPTAEGEIALSAVRTFASAAGDVPEQDWSLGWHARAGNASGRGRR